MSYSVAVRTLCEFTARAGDLDLRFTPAPTGPEGVAGHATVVDRRTAAYESEIALSGQYQDLLVRGRADGYDPDTNQLEEIKTYRGELSSVRDNHRALHWAQACIYGHLFCQARGISRLRVAVVYFNVVTEEETQFPRDYDAAELRTFFEEQCARFQAWATTELAHRQARDLALAQLDFPLGQFRAGQRELAVSVYRTARDGGCLLAQASTGIGKTLGTLFPLLKAAPDTRIDKVFFLAAKNAGKALAQQALDRLNESAAQPGLRALDLQARDKVCVYPDKACHGESCPLARGFYDRLPEARAAALAHTRLDGSTVRTVAQAHGVCPYYLSQELARWSDVVIGDYNYYFDSNAILYALAQAHQWRVAVLVDEAHNLVDRARHMYSSTLSQPALKRARQAAPKALRKLLDGLNRAWNALNRKQACAYQAYDAVPAGLLAAVQKAIVAVAEHVGQAPLAQDDPLLLFYFEMLSFARLAEQFGPHALFDVTRDRRDDSDVPTSPSTLCVRNVVPAPHLAARYAAAHATVLFSATLNPQQYYRDTLGLPDKTGWIEVAAPFQAEQLTVHVAGNVSTRYRDRKQSLRPIVDLIAAQYAKNPGNYLSFLSSFEYLEQVADLLSQCHPQVPLWKQTPAMNEAGREAFLARFTESGSGVGFAVLGGAFSEAVDLPGKRLIGAFIATLGLPQVNPVNEQMKAAMEKLYGKDQGYDYTYLYPGLQKVVQAAGRVIRGEHDTGTVYLIDDRYRRGKVQALLPGWWQLGAVHLSQTAPA
ncbi:ATP-dependent DNA helicase [Bordetella genomosp. 4]|uniref:ATP-dependent DNA helicase n=1 Tax=Bordetella genomosp. 4 TaxID=463044 RepID=A0A261U4D4_9BORD|nr:ATP-dependent DNA helicase [Bordetella genomosp. 4]OZI56272.1 ATP-dependent DNA helicase [Bordetella genomosp. 4]